MEPYTDVGRQAAILRLVAAVISNAHYMADMTAAFLKANGFRPKKRAAGPSARSPGKCPAVARANAFLLNLAAALRIAAWERSGLQPILPPSLPSSSEALRNVVPPAVPGPEERPLVPELPVQVLWTGLQLFSWSSHAALGTDVPLPVGDVSEDEMLDALADLLWRNRHLAKPREH